MTLYKDSALRVILVERQYITKEQLKTLPTSGELAKAFKACARGLFKRGIVSVLDFQKALFGNKDLGNFRNLRNSVDDILKAADLYGSIPEITDGKGWQYQCALVSLVSYRAGMSRFPARIHGITALEWPEVFAYLPESKRAPFENPLPKARHAAKDLQ